MGTLTLVGKSEHSHAKSEDREWQFLSAKRKNTVVSQEFYIQQIYPPKMKVK